MNVARKPRERPNPGRTAVRHRIEKSKTSVHSASSASRRGGDRSRIERRGCHGALPVDVAGSLIVALEGCIAWPLWRSA